MTSFPLAKCQTVHFAENSAADTMSTATLDLTDQMAPYAAALASANSRVLPPLPQYGALEVRFHKATCPLRYADVGITSRLPSPWTMIGVVFLTARTRTPRNEGGICIARYAGRRMSVGRSTDRPELPCQCCREHRVASRACAITGHDILLSW